MTQYTKKWDVNKDKVDFDIFVQNFIKDPSNYQCEIVSTVVTRYGETAFTLEKYAIKGFIIYNHKNDKN